MEALALNRSDRSWCHHSYVLWFGAGSVTHLFVYANSLDGAVGIAADWLAENAPGCLADEEVQDEFKRLKGENQLNLPFLSDEQLWAQATVDTTETDGAQGGHFLHSWEWGLVQEDPSTEWIDYNTVKPAKKAS